MSDSRRPDFSRRNQQSSSRSNRSSRTQGSGPPDPLAPFHNRTPRYAEPTDQLPASAQHAQSPNNHNNYTLVTNHVGPAYVPGPASNHGYPQDRHSMAPRHYSRTLPAHGMNERHEDEGQYQQYGQYAQDQQFQSSQPYRRDQPLPAHGMNELREDESQYQQYGQYAQGQQFQPSHPNRRDQPLPAHGMNERHEDEGRYQQYGQYAQGQQFQPSHPNRRDQYRERVIRYENYQGSNDGDDEHDDYGEPDDLQNMSGHIRTQLAHPRRVSTQGELDPRYVLQNPEYFEQGKVFSILWHENEGLAGRRGDTHVSVGPSFRGRYNEPIYSTIRRMVVLRAFDRYSWCFSISTYGGRGLAKPGVDPSKHTIVYMRDTQPTRSSRERGIVKEPLMVEPERLDESLDSMSRLNFGKIYTVEHNVKVLPIGKIADELMPKFMSYARAELAI